LDASFRRSEILSGELAPLPASRRPHTRAIDSRTDKIVWQKSTPYELQNGSGFTATAGDLLFHGDPTGEIQAFDARRAINCAVPDRRQRGRVSLLIRKRRSWQYIAVATSGNVWASSWAARFNASGADAATDRNHVPGRVEATDQIVISPTIGDGGLEFVRQATDEYAFLPIRQRSPSARR